MLIFSMFQMQVFAKKTILEGKNVGTEARYKVEYYYQKDGVYPSTATSSVVYCGQKDTYVVVTDKEKTPTQNGFVFDENNSQNALNGTIDGNGNPVLKVYFKQQFTVSYKKGDHGTFTEGEAGKTSFSQLDYNDKTPSYDGEKGSDDKPAGEATGGTMQYALGTAAEATEFYTTSIPAKTDAGTYYMWYKVKGDANHKDTVPACITVKISEDNTNNNNPNNNNNNNNPNNNGNGKTERITISKRPKLCARRSRVSRYSMLTISPLPGICILILFFLYILPPAFFCHHVIITAEGGERRKLSCSVI